MGDYNIKWTHFEEHLKDISLRLYDTKWLSDVTLISDDLTEFPAHKFILCAGSNKLDQLFSKIEASRPTLYLKGIHDQQLKAILQYLYMGKAVVTEENLQEFLINAKELEIKDLDIKDPLEFLEYNLEESITLNEEPIETRDVMYLKGEKSSNKEQQKNIFEKRSDEEPIETKDVNHFKEEKSSNKEQQEKKVFKKSAGKFSCQECNSRFTQRHSLTQHIEGVHKGISYSCEHCDKEYKQKSHLRRHILLTHKKDEIIQLSCEYCEKTFNHRDHFLRHIKNSHDKVKQPKISALKRHMNIKQE